ncbi:hypothetical protein [Streptomyces milbemycinicus]|uniref:Uncharacterized protein n=1 Tax=Streptomyces milbemycinicus TaxID=476552 RepID=A0ABW8M5P6_9ACTN
MVSSQRWSVNLAPHREHAGRHTSRSAARRRRVYPPTGREGTPPVAFVFADTTAAKVANAVRVLEEIGRRYWAPHRYDTHHRGIMARDYRQANIGQVRSISGNVRPKLAPPGRTGRP